VLRNWSIVRTGSTAAQKSLFFNLRRLRAQIESRNEAEGLSDANRQEIATTLNVRVKDVESMEGRLAASDQSLNATISEDGEQDWQSMLVDHRPNPEDIVTDKKDAQSRSARRDRALSDLDDREQTIIKIRHLGQDGVTLETLGDQLGISKERVRQIEKRAMEKMKSSIEGIEGVSAAALF
jgi:RNA polymerase sigma-32 factor